MAREARKTFPRGGVHPPERKQATAGLAIEATPLPTRVLLPLQQHLGAPAKALVAKKDTVSRGQRIAEAGGFVSAPVHSSVAGTVKDVIQTVTTYGVQAAAIEIDVAEEQPWADGIAAEPAAELPTEDPKALLAALKEAGLVGMGGAAFPTHVKLAPPPDARIDTLILNGAECEPYLTADHRLMVERAEGVARGADVMRRILGLDVVHVGVEDNKPDALDTLDALTGRFPWLRVHPLRTQYPQGAEKQLIKAVTGREVPSGRLPLHVGAIVQNVGTAFAAYEAVYQGKPLIERVVTISGGAVASPKNLQLPLGTLAEDAVALCGGATAELARVVYGGPMMGKAMRSLAAPVIKGTSGILLLTHAEAPLVEEEDCIRCGMCVGACPQGLTPCDLATLAEYEALKQAGDVGLLDCVECGSCNYICPARRRLVQWIRLGKARFRALPKSA